jgi:hypothetical protein
MQPFKGPAHRMDYKWAFDGAKDPYTAEYDHVKMLYPSTLRLDFCANANRDADTGSVILVPDEMQVTADDIRPEKQSQAISVKTY